MYSIAVVPEGHRLEGEGGLELRLTAAVFNTAPLQ